jgi:hypothetical protein
MYIRQNFTGALPLDEDLHNACRGNVTAMRDLLSRYIPYKSRLPTDSEFSESK